jgi:hypothetical protein
MSIVELSSSSSFFKQQYRTVERERGREGKRIGFEGIWDRTLKRFCGVACGGNFDLFWSSF